MAITLVAWPAFCASAQRCCVVWPLRRAIHTVAAFLSLSPEADLPDVELAAMLEHRALRDLLRAAIPHAPPRLYRALDRAGDRIREAAFYERLSHLCSSPLADSLLTDGALDEQRLRSAEQLLTMDPALLSIPKILSHASAEIEAVATLIAYLRSQNAFADADLHFAKGAGLPAVVRRLQKFLDRVAAPTCPFILRPPLRIIRTIGDLREAGVTLCNCVSQYDSYGCGHWFRLAEGLSVYIASDAPPFLAALRRVGPDLWVLDELVGKNNEDIDAESRARLTDALHAAGVHLLQQDPVRALSRLGRHAAHPRDDDLEDDLAA